MPNRSFENTSKAHFQTFTVANGQTATAGRFGVVVGDMLVRDATAGEEADVFFPESAEPTGRVNAILMPGPAVVRVLVGTGGATAGVNGEIVSNGVADAPTASGGASVLHHIVCKFLESGAVGNIVSAMLRSIDIEAAS